MERRIVLPSVQSVCLCVTLSVRHTFHSISTCIDFLAPELNTWYAGKIGHV